MDSPNHPVTSPFEPETLGSAPEVPAPESSPPPMGAPVAATAPVPRRRVVSDLSGDLISSVQSLMGTVVIAIFVITFIVQAFQIPSESMENTLLVGDYLLPYQRIKRGDIIVFHYPVDPKQHFVRRVIGLPGDRLRLVNKKVFINGKPLDEPYDRFLEPANNP